MHDSSVGSVDGMGFIYILDKNRCYGVAGKQERWGSLLSYNYLGAAIRYAVAKIITFLALEIRTEGVQLVTIRLAM